MSEYNEHSVDQIIACAFSLNFLDEKKFKEPTILISVALGPLRRNLNVACLDTRYLYLLQLFAPSSCRCAKYLRTQHSLCLSAYWLQITCQRLGWVLLQSLRRLRGQIQSHVTLWKWRKMVTANVASSVILKRVCWQWGKRHFFSFILTEHDCGDIT